MSSLDQQPDLHSDSAIEAIDDLLGAVGLQHGRRRLLAEGYVPQARHPRQEGPERQLREAIQPDAMATVHSPLLRAAGIAHGFSTRQGGVSTAYSAQNGDVGELNLGFTASDTEENVRKNRARLLRDVFGDRDPALLTLKQTHSATVHRVTAQDADRVIHGDGLLTDDPALALGIQTADCVPVLLADRKTGAVGAFHAGWRGTLHRIVERGVGTMRLEFGTDPKDIVAAIGPSIGPCCYAVGEDDVQFAFRSQFAYADELFCEVFDSDPVKKKYPMLFLTMRAPGHSELGPSIHLDLAEANRRQLLDAGVPAEQISLSGKCTSCRTDLFFSYRAEHAFNGRMLSVIAPPASR